ncbi:DUF47 domain-containing protein [Ornithinimicrobium cavernae]|uniref:DUF47 domain-containing protein n=1 Tax=Ornithinimicrobium cavernae TaxID=2666047 RepID=UPI001F3863BD|nr:DUF47 family protein [Ornithinimicrobium cavernae]
MSRSIVAVRFKLTPQNTTFYGQFADLATHIRDGAHLLKATVEGPPGEWKAAAQRLKDIEHHGDEATHTIMSAVNSSFITPFDRDDIYRLAARLDDCLDHIEASLDIMVLYRVQELPAAVTEQVDVLVEMADLTLEAMPGLQKMHHLREFWIAINSLENVADRNYRRMIAALFDGERDAVDIIRYKALYDELEAAADSFETVANTVESIAAKES